MHRKPNRTIRPRRSRARLALAFVALATGLIAPFGVAATTVPQQLVLDQVTASTVADRWFPIVRDADVPPDCLVTPAIECPGGIPRAPSTNLRFTRASLAAPLFPPADFGVTAELRVDTVDPIIVNVFGVDCELTVDTSGGTPSTITASTRGSIRSSLLFDYNYIEAGDVVIDGLQPDDVDIGGAGLVCSAYEASPSLLGVVETLLESQLRDLVTAEGPLCGAPGPGLLAICPWFTLGPSVDFGDQALGLSSTQQITITNAGPAYPYFIEIGQITIEGPDASDYSISGDGCSNRTVLMGPCTLDVTFTPSGSGTRSAQLNVPSTWVESPGTVALAGVGVAPTADVSAAISAAAGGGKARSRLTYTITVSNSGPSTATGIVINDALPSQTTFVSATTGQGTCTAPAVGTSGAVRCSIGSLASGASIQIQIVVAVTARRASFTNTVTVSTTTSDPDPSDNIASVTTRVR